MQNNLLDKMTDDCKVEFLKIRASIGWQAVQEIVNNIIKNECDPDDVDASLEPVDFKAEIIGKRKAKKMFLGVFEETASLLEVTENESKDYS